MDTLFRDVHHAVRSLRRTPGFTIAVVLILALGIGMSTAMFTVSKTVLVEGLPIAAQDRMVIMHTLDRSGRNLDVPAAYLPEIARDSAVFDDQNPFVPFEFGGPDYFRTLAIPILRGRGFTASDTRGSERVVVVNATLARQLWPSEHALGKRLVLVTGPTRDTAFTVVGIASDTRLRELRNVGPVAYFASEQVETDFPNLLAVRTTSPLAAMLPVLRDASHDINPALVLWEAQTMDQLLDAPLAQPRLSALLLSGFSLVALLLSAIGLYGIMAAGVRRQTHDIGIRVALGAIPDNIRRLVLAQVSGLVGVGVIAGLAGALAASRLLRSMLFQVSPTDPLTLAGVCVLLLAVATAAGYLPARRAARIDPVEALRVE